MGTLAAKAVLAKSPHVRHRVIIAVTTPNNFFI
jgi:hypothetical protein